MVEKAKIGTTVKTTYVKMLIKEDPFKAILEILLGNLLAEHNLIYGFVLLMEFLFRLLKIKEFQIRIVQSSFESNIDFRFRFSGRKSKQIVKTNIQHKIYLLNSDLTFPASLKLFRRLRLLSSELSSKAF